MNRINIRLPGRISQDTELTCSCGHYFGKMNVIKQNNPCPQCGMQYEVVQQKTHGHLFIEQPKEEVEKKIPYREIMDKWDKGEFTYSGPEEALRQLNAGEKIGSILRNCTICPVRNGTCVERFTIVVAGYHPEKGTKEVEIWICPSGAKTIDECCLSK